MISLTSNERNHIEVYIQYDLNCVMYFNNLFLNRKKLPNFECYPHITHMFILHFIYSFIHSFFHSYTFIRHLLYTRVEDQAGEHNNPQGSYGPHPASSRTKRGGSKHGTSKGTEMTGAVIPVAAGWQGAPCRWEARVRVRKTPRRRRAGRVAGLQAAEGQTASGASGGNAGGQGQGQA